MKWRMQNHFLFIIHNSNSPYAGYIFHIDSRAGGKILSEWKK